MKKENTSKNSCMLVVKLLAIAAMIVALLVLLKKIFKMINEKDAMKNYNNELRRYFACFTALNENLGKNEIHCIKLSSYFSAVTLDLSKADLSADLTLDLSGICSAVKVIIPAGCNVANVSDNKNSVINYDDIKLFDVPTITLVGRIRGCAISFERAE